MQWKRRDWFKQLGSVFAWVALPASAKAAANEQNAAPLATVPPSDPGTFRESYELIVVGGGIAGTSAAISAARNGVKVALVHERSMLGGNSSSEVKLFPENGAGHQPWIKEGGIHEEFHTEERVRNHQAYKEGTMNCHWDLVLYEWAIREPNLTLYLNTHMHRVVMDTDKRIRAVYCIQLGTEKTFELEAPLFIDATGDGVLAHRAGADYRWGREAKNEYGEALAPDIADEKLMGNTLFFRAVDTGNPVPFKLPDWAVSFDTEADLTSRNHSYLEGGYWWIEVGAPWHPIKDNNEITHEALRQLLGVWDHIKNKGDHGAQNYGLEFAGFWPYKRECRRILGDYVLTQQHIQNPQPLRDSVAYGVWGIDIHTQGGILARNERPYPPPEKDDQWEERGIIVYGIPLRSLYSRNIENMMMAGRPISGSYIAFASSRVLSTGSIVGQATGVAAALCKKYNTSPRVVARDHAQECQQIILRQGGHIPGVKNEDANDLARRARVTASSEAALSFPVGETELEMAMPLAQIFPVSAKRVDYVDLFIASKSDEDETIQLGLSEAPAVWDFRSAGDIAQARSLVHAKSSGWVRFHLSTRVRPDRLYFIHTDIHRNLYWKTHSENETDLNNRCPVGVTAGSLPSGTRWRPFTNGRTFAMRIAPASFPYGAQNIVHGTNRPDDWTNIWISEVERDTPAWIELRWPRRVSFNTVEITFDTNANRRVTLPLFRYPECVRDYHIQCGEGSSTRDILRVEGNYERRRVHRFDRVTTDRLRLNVLATNGVNTARVYEVRVYDQA
ncbi:MAG: FAD-dependent oxidoreductase [Candidatus Hydrogenedentes bacterium]|nr:FAD-dependent oxidoreductase [Candidatus Hydrogenedentota bacterium]